MATRFALLFATLLAAGAGAFAQQSPGRSALDLPARTDAGDWGGSWYYVSRDSHVALWLRGEGARTELRLQYLNTGRVESFATDWSGRTSYRFDGKPAVFALELTERDANTLRGKWTWELGQGELRRTETAWVTIYRAGDGRSLVMNFEDLERYHGGIAGSRLSYPQVWVFRKASNNQRRWEELPF